MCAVSVHVGSVKTSREIGPVLCGCVYVFDVFAHICTSTKMGYKHEDKGGGIKCAVGRTSTGGNTDAHLWYKKPQCEWVPIYQTLCVQLMKGKRKRVCAFVRTHTRVIRGRACVCAKLTPRTRCVMPGDSTHSFALLYKVY